jgi:hypothetical protein
MATDEAVSVQPSLLTNSHTAIGNGTIPEENEAMKISLEDFVYGTTLRYNTQYHHLHI